MDGNLPFLDDEARQQETPEVTAEPTPVETAPEPEASKGEPVAAPPAAVEETKHIPITALLDEREKRQQAAREAEDLRKKLAEMEARLNPPKKVDFFEDPETALKSVQQTAQAIAINTKLETSRFLAERDHGKEEVAEAYAFFDANPHLSQQLLTSPSPFHEAVKVYQKHKALQEMGDDPAAYRARIEAEIRERVMAEMAQPRPTSAPPPSLATATSAGPNKGPVVSGFAQMFGD